MRKGRVARPHRWLLRAGLIVLPLLPLVANSFGWIFTEMGRQPWIVFGLMLTRDGVSRSVAPAEVLTSLVAFTLLYGVARRGRGRACCCGTPRPALPDVTPAPPDAGRHRRRAARSPSPTERSASWNCTTIWFLLIAVLFTGYFVLEGFDFGVGMLLPVLGRDDRRTPAC